VSDGESVKIRYVIILRCCRNVASLYKVWSYNEKEIGSIEAKCRTSKIRILCPDKNKCTEVIGISVEICVRGQSCLMCRYNHMNINSFPVRLKMNNQSRGGQGKEDDVEMADPAPTGLTSVFVTIVSGFQPALNMCNSKIDIVIWNMLNKYLSSCRAVISLDCLLSCYTWIVKNVPACTVVSQIDKSPPCTICSTVFTNLGIYAIVELTFIIWCGRYGE
jgi:hypothetical protein